MRNPFSRAFRCIALASAVLALAPASAQSFADLAQSSNPNRHQQLVEAAKKEGSVTFYTSIPEKDMAILSDGFEKKYGVKVNTWRASTQKVVQRVLTERQANRWDFDAVDISGPEMEALYQEKVLQEVHSSFHKDAVEGTMPAHRGWAPQFLTVFVQAYNTNAVKKQDLPKTYFDLLDPKWKGMLGVEANDAEWYCGILKQVGEARGSKLFQDLVANNGWSVRRGHSLLANLVVSGEVPLGLTVYSYMVDQAKQKGAPVEWFAIDPVIGRANGIGVSRRPPHPNAALLFYEYMISEAQPLMAKMNYLPAVKHLPSPFKDIKLSFIDPAAPRAEVERCEGAFLNLLKANK